jgi:hypothetical protein
VSNEFDNRIEIELLKKDVTTMTSLLEKFDTTIDKMQEIASSLSRMVSLQEQRLESQELVTKEVQSILEMRRQEHNADIKDLHSRITTVNRELTEKIEETEKTILDELHAMRAELKADKGNLSSRLGNVEAWRYTIVGALIFGAWLLGQAFNIAKFFN